MPLGDLVVVLLSFGAVVDLFGALGDFVALGSFGDFVALGSLGVFVEVVTGALGVFVPFGDLVFALLYVGGFVEFFGDLGDFVPLGSVGDLVTPIVGLTEFLGDFAFGDFAAFVVGVTVGVVVTVRDGESDCPIDGRSDGEEDDVTEGAPVASDPIATGEPDAVDVEDGLEVG